MLVVISIRIQHLQKNWDFALPNTTTLVSFNSIQNDSVKPPLRSDLPRDSIMNLTLFCSQNSCHQFPWQALAYCRDRSGTYGTLSYLEDIDNFQIEGPNESYESCIGVRREREIDIDDGILIGLVAYRAATRDC